MILIVTGNSCVGKTTLVKELAEKLGVRVFDVDAWTTLEYTYNIDFKNALVALYGSANKSHIASMIKQKSPEDRLEMIGDIQLLLKKTFTIDLTYFIESNNGNGIIDMAQFHESTVMVDLLQEHNYIVVCVTASETDRIIMAAKRGVDLTFMDSIQYSPIMKSALSDFTITNDINKSATDTIAPFMNTMHEARRINTMMVELVDKWYGKQWPSTNQTFSNAFECFTFDIVCQYAENGMAYHNINHIQFMLSKINTLDIDNVENAILLFIAVMCHDVVYDINSKTNEEDSAKMAAMLIEYYFSKCHFVDHFIVAELILATKWGHDAMRYKSLGDPIIQQLIQDLDLAILSAPYQEVCHYDDMIFLEYNRHPTKYSTAVYFSERIKFLESVLKLPRIYHGNTPDHEAAARFNVQQLLVRNARELTKLEEIH